MAKATYQCDRCGADITITGHNRSDANHRAEYFASSGGLCHECWAKARDEERAQKAKLDAEMAKASGLPELTGSDKQITWAETIRAKAVPILGKKEAWAETQMSRPDTSQERLSLAARTEIYDAHVCIISEVCAHAEAHYWIERRDRDWGTWIVEQMQKRQLIPTALAEIEALKAAQGVSHE